MPFGDRCMKQHKARGQWCYFRQSVQGKPPPVRRHLKGDLKQISGRGSRDAEALKNSSVDGVSDPESE